MVEILAPAGDEQSAYRALLAGADAVYLGLKQFSARAFSGNFDEEALFRVTRYAHLLGAKVYVALNTLVKDSELNAFFANAKSAWEAGADAILIQDIFLGRELLRRWPEMVLHLSTQAGCCNVWGAEVAKQFGFSRVVLARETPIEEIRKISQIIETEVFVQGALCTAFSGQCYFSSFAGGNSGNRGRCKQPCRKCYTIDRGGYEKKAYALSTSDLSVGTRIEDFLAAGVSSLKIEGRMRRPEYVVAAVDYYRALLEKRSIELEKVRLMRAYNRGDYTEGLAFGQNNTFLSRNAQGHIGERIGTVSFRHGAPVCSTNAEIAKGDGLKILRGGKEVGGAVVEKLIGGGFQIAAKEKLCAGDEVRLTSSAANELPIHPAKTRHISIFLRFVAGEVPQAVCGDVVCEGKEPLPAAKSAPLTEEELAACFQKTDGLPLLPEITVETAGAFLPKSALNAFRREFYAALVNRFAPAREPLPAHDGTIELLPEKGDKSARIASRGQKGDDILIYKPHDYAKCELPAGAREVYLYLPPYFTSADEALISSLIGRFDGIYCEGYYGIALAGKYGKKLFAGTGWNITNKYAAAGAQDVSEYFALSKELALSEIAPLSLRGAFFLAGGDIKVMDLCYCPFERTCKNCDGRDFYRMTDEEGRAFTLRRYKVSGMVCRFEVYNCAYLAESTGMPSVLYDDSAVSVRPKMHTRGHLERSFL